ncbi:MAG: hypothetical protein LAN84_09720 [Acidobacteriia bacterium]|nr:hypothetical protein [Terriglobia bacterium]
MSDSQGDGYKECEHPNIQRLADGIWRCADCPETFSMDEIQDLLFGREEPQCAAGEKA